MFLSKGFRDTFRDIIERALFAIGLSLSAVLLHFAIVGCETARVDRWIVLVLRWTFDFIVLADALTIIGLTVALLIRLTFDTFRELKGFMKGP